jgi:4-hydroxy 2-oxovalerate aldolase
MFHIVDCTFRDGGYQTNWHFDISLVEEYLYLIHQFGVQIVEIGFRSSVTAENSDSGPFLFSDEKFLRTLSLPGDLQLAVMINADEISNVEVDIDSLFINASQSRVSLVRIATRLSALAKSHQIASHLQRKGYKVALNLMESSPELLRGEDFRKKAELFAVFDYLFLADSFGVLSPAEIKEIDTLIRPIRPDYGLHLHNNRELAYANSLVAVQEGIQFLDATALGLGRGAGNLRTEQLIIDICQENILGSIKFSKLITVLQNLHKSAVEGRQKGLDTLYLLGAKYNFHPNVVFGLIQDENAKRAVELLTGQEDSTKSV